MIKSGARSIVATLKVYESYILVNRLCKSLFVRKKNMISQLHNTSIPSQADWHCLQGFRVMGIETIVESDDVYLVQVLERESKGKSTVSELVPTILDIIANPKVHELMRKSA